MRDVRRVSAEVYVADAGIVNIGRPEIAFLKNHVRTTEHKRIRLCAHKSIDEKLHEMFIVLASGAYVRPSKHLDKDESAHILEGVADYIFFDDGGRITQIVPMSPYPSEGRFYCRVPVSVYHMLRVRSEVVVIHESAQGPFIRSGTVLAPWAPDEADGAAIDEFLRRIDGAVRHRGKS